MIPRTHTNLSVVDRIPLPIIQGVLMPLFFSSHEFKNKNGE
jgi:hypothetical protein